MSDNAPTAEPPPTVYQAMARVLADLPAIAKNDKAPGSMGGYAFRGIEGITAALKPLLGVHGVFCVPTTLERRDSERSVGGSKTMFVVDVLVQFTFYGPAGDSVAGSAWGQGSDMGDKSPQKAYTSALKTTLGQVFCIADAATDAERHDVPDTTRSNEPIESPWFRESGWAGQAEHDDAVGAFREALRAVPDEALGVVITAWRKANNVGWGMVTRAQFDELTGIVAARVDPLTGEKLPVPQSAPSGAVPHDPPPEGHSGENTGQSDDPADSVPCALCGSTRSKRVDSAAGVHRCELASRCAERVATRVEAQRDGPEQEVPPVDNSEPF